MTLFGRFVLGLALAVAADAAALEKLAEKVTDFTLGNGMRIVLLERHTTPVVSLHLRSKLGVADEPPGKSGVAYMMERMSLRGGAVTGSRDPAAESAGLAKAEEWFDERDKELSRGSAANLLIAQEYKLKARVQLDLAARVGFESVISHGFALNQIENVSIKVHPDSTDVVATGPANRVELWYKLIGDWMQRPSPRYFYADKDRMLLELEQQLRHSIYAKMYAALFPAAFGSHPYSHLSVAAKELESLRAKDGVAFVQKVFDPKNLVLAIVGDMTPATARALAERYFGKLTGASAGDLQNQETPAMEKEKRLEVVDDNETIWGMGWARPGRDHADQVFFDLLPQLLNAGQNSPLNKELMGERGLANTVQVLPSFPGGRMGSLFFVLVVPLAGVDSAEIEGAVQRALATVIESPVQEPALKNAKLRLRAALFREFDSYSSLAHLIARTTGDYGSVARLSEYLKKLDAISGADVQQAATRYLSKQRRIIVAGGQMRVSGGVQ